MTSEIKKLKNDLFDRIARYYGLFYQYQKRKYSNLLDKIYNELDLVLYRSVIDIGCGTGAFCSELYRRGFRVTGLDSSAEMLKVARQKLRGEIIELVRSDFVKGTPFEDKSFDVSVASFVAHGLQPEERNMLYQEMHRITKNMIIIYDYNEKRSVLTNMIEWLEGGDYFNFIKIVKRELNEYFGDVRVLNIGEHASCYVIKL